MPDTGRRRPSRVATCEEWDEEANAVLPGSRTSANVAVKRSEQELDVRRREDSSAKNGVDSGYASRADTLVSEPMSIRRKANELRIETPPAVILERDRQPYHVPQSAPIKPSSRRQSSSQAKTSTPERRPINERCVHERGSCQICDHFGWHIDFTKDMPRASSMAPPQPPSPTATRQVVAPRAKDDEAIPPKTRRSSSTRKQRPLSVLTNPTHPPQYAAQPIFAAPVFATSGWPTPMTPSQYVAPAYSYGPPAPNSASAQYAPYPQNYPYHEPASYSEPRSAKPSRRSSPVRPVTVKHVQVDPGFTGLDRVSSKDNRPTLTSHRSNRSIDQDRVIMGPPPKPQPAEIILPRRPSARRSKTYHTEEPVLRQQSSRDPLRYDDEEHDNYPELRPTISNRGRRESPSRPPNSYRAPSHIESRPMLSRKSVSYSTPEAITKVASSKNNSHRRTTLPSTSVPMEQKEAAAEAYQQKRSSAIPDLTMENLRDLNKGNTSSRSETGSSYSHKSHQSSSKDSSRGRSYTTSGAGTSITFPGGLGVSIPANYKSERPLSINIGDVTISMNSQDREAERPREQKRIERAPSVASKASRRSIASSNVSNNEPSKKPSRRTSQLEERSKLSRQHSRAPSTTGHTYEYSVSRRQSVDFPNKYEDYPGYGA